MTELKIKENIKIDEPENVVRAIYNMTGKQADIELIRKFILNEKHTMFYLDRRLNSSTEPEGVYDYLWLDTGYMVQNKNPIFICLHHSMDGYYGHYTGTMKSLVSRVREFNPKNIRDINKNYSRLVSKYEKRAVEREHAHIEDEMTYAVTAANATIEDETQTAFAQALSALDIDFPANGNGEEEPEEIEAELVDPGFTKEQEEITMGLLWDKIVSMQQYIEELLGHIENKEKDTKEEIDHLKEQNEEYKRALTGIRSFMDAEEQNAKKREEENSCAGHNLLGRNGKILVLGNTDIRVAEMRAIARDLCGFEKSDFEFETDYDKVKNAGERIHNSSRYAAVIFGNCPHKVAGMGNWSSIIEEFTHSEDCPFSIDARTKAGGLKITKESYRKALMEVYCHLREAC